MNPKDTSKMMRAAGLVIARQAQALAESATTTANEIIELAPALCIWHPGPHAAGSVVSHEGVPYKCIQAHDSAGNAGWSPDKTPALWAPYHATDAAHALPYQQPTMAEDSYRRGEWMVWTDGMRYMAMRDAVDRGPDVLPEDWEAEVVEE